jgi:hypothetical protein
MRWNQRYGLRNYLKSRHAALLQELSLLDREIVRNFTYPEELALARIGDTQGLGGHSGKKSEAASSNA